MKSLTKLLAMSSFLLVIEASHAQQSTAEAEESRNIALQLDFIGTNALFFSMATSSSVAVRIGAELTSQSNDGRRDEDYHSESTGSSGTSTIDRTTIYDDDYSDLYARLSIVGLYDVVDLNSIQFAVGAGPFIGYRHGERNTKNDRISSPTEQYYSDGETKEWEYGLIALVSARTVVAGRLGVHVDFSVSAFKSTGDEISTDRGEYSGFSYSNKRTAKLSSNNIHIEGFTAGIVVFL